MNNQINDVLKSRNDFAKWSYKLEKENKKMKQHIEKIVSENIKLQNKSYGLQSTIQQQEDYIEHLKHELFKSYMEN